MGRCCGNKQQAPDFRGILPSVSYAPFEGTGHPDVDNIPSVEKIRADLKTLAPLTRAIRLYSSTGGVELVPPIAAEFGLKVTVGAWIDKNAERNEREIAGRDQPRQAQQQRQRHRRRQRDDLPRRAEGRRPDRSSIKQVKRRSGSMSRVTTGEIWNIWRDNPELALAVDFIAAHVLPYWENFSDKQAVDQAVYLYQMLRDTFPASGS